MAVRFLPCSNAVLISLLQLLSLNLHKVGTWLYLVYDHNNGVLHRVCYVTEECRHRKFISPSVHADKSMTINPEVERLPHIPYVQVATLLALY